MAGVAAEAVPASNPDRARASRRTLTCAKPNTSSLAGVRRVGLSMLAVIVVAAIVWVVASRGGGEDKTAIGTTTETRKAPPPVAKPPRDKRQRVRKGRGTQPDRPARGTGALLAIADQKPETFSDPLFRKLGVARSRLNTPWNSIFAEPDRLAAWLQAARAAGVEPLVAFEHARGDQCPA